MPIHLPEKTRCRARRNQAEPNGAYLMLVWLLVATDCSVPPESHGGRDGAPTRVLDTQSAGPTDTSSVSALARAVEVEGGALVPPKPVCPPYAERLADGRKATAERRYGDAVAAFRDALLAAPFDASAHAELGYAMILAGNPDEAGADLDFAIAEADGPVKGVALFNMGLRFAEMAKGVGSSPRGDAGAMTATEAIEWSRAYFAAAATLGSTAALRRLSGRSTCPAVRTVTGLSPLDIDATWRGLAKRIEFRLKVKDALGPHERRRARGV